MRFSTLKLLLAIIVASVILLGVICGRAELVLAGALLDLLFGIIELFHFYKKARLLRAGTEGPVEVSGKSFCVAKWTQRAIALTGLVLVIVTQDEETSGYSIAGWIIWCGTLVRYYVFGVIMREVGGVPLSMGYGGWAVRRGRKGP